MLSLSVNKIFLTIFSVRIFHSSASEFSRFKLIRRVLSKVCGIIQLFDDKYLIEKEIKRKKGKFNLKVVEKRVVFL
jgi:hypothetical protein